jgi:hypothetical protein
MTLSNYGSFDSPSLEAGACEQLVVTSSIGLPRDSWSLLLPLVANLDRLYICHGRRCSFDGALERIQTATLAKSPRENNRLEGIYWILKHSTLTIFSTPHHRPSIASYFLALATPQDQIQSCPQNHHLFTTPGTNSQTPRRNLPMHL